MKRILIDTNIYSSALHGDTGVANVLRTMDEIGFSVISIGELLAGFKCGNMEEKNRTELDIFLDSPRVVIYTIDENTSEFYAQILTSLKKIGKPVPTNDIWIAATAFQNGLQVFTKDAHFSFIPGIYIV